MSLGSINDYHAIAAKLSDQSGKGGDNSVRNAGLKKAFDMQMQMTRNLFGEGSVERGEGSSLGGFDTSFINDAMMMEALTTITRLMRSESGALARPVANKAQPSNSLPSVQPPVVEKSAVESNKFLGGLSAQFESGTSGIATIGYDRVGGTSYGKYQIASRPGTMDRFLNYLDANAPDVAERLREAGPANTGSKEGQMPTVWRQLAEGIPERFERLQHDFIESETYDPARRMIMQKTGLDFEKAPNALQEVLWSTSVQHGPTGAARIFEKVIDRFVGGLESGDFNAQLIEGVYDVRKGQFGSSTKRVQEAVANRFDSEKTIAMNMLGSGLSRIV
ncbi:conserved protein of unknown function [Pseudodesulfovibrio profundus]|uniref:Type VI secretion system spike protein VgrG3-like C-terminal domain-containing protein n=1 Tax=Pseudodesulfovibrio profundus TaxID=57320 RepID=A0A2C8F3D8_9BACT|nr:hypothetical protein [Pseudodesulfovibrio profundus]SOB57018.1 conserved protein of unknown function [Pseudodesulfovibrio profundus]